ncbi:hypothetical protein D3C76_703350 [compost metagenome]
MLEWRFKGVDHVGVAGQRAADDFADALAADRGAVFVQAPGFLQLMHHGRYAARTMETFAQVFACRHAVDQQGYVFADALPVIEAQLDAHMAGDGNQVRRAVTRCPQCRGHGDRIFEGCTGHDLRRTHILHDQFADALAGGVGHLSALTVRRRNARATRQRHAQGFSQGVHRQGGAHGVAVAHRGRGRGGHFHEAFVIDFPGGHQVACMPEYGARADQFTFVVAIEHRPARQDNGRKISGGGGHQAGRGGLVATGGEDDTIEWIAVENLHQPQISQVTVQCSRRPA